MPLNPGALQIAAHSLRARLKPITGKDLKVEIQKDDRLKVTALHLKPADAAACRKIIETAALLTLSGVHPESDKADENGVTLAERVRRNQELVPGYRAFVQVFDDGYGGTIEKAVLVNRRAAIRNEDIKFARKSAVGESSLDIELNPAGTDKMIALTKDLRPGRDRVAIMLDGKVLSAPVVNQVPLGRNFIIEGLNQPGEIDVLIATLKHPLENRLIIEQKQPMRRSPSR